MSIAPEAVGGMPPPGGPMPPGPGAPGSMADLMAAFGAGGPDPTGGASPDPSAPPDDQGGSDLLSGMNATDHIRAAIKHLMMAMTESNDDEESHGVLKGMAALQGILGGKAKNAKTIQAAGG